MCVTLERLRELFQARHGDDRDEFKKKKSISIRYNLNCKEKKKK